MNFKVGDKVKRITHSSWPERFGKQGKVYTVLDVIGPRDSIVVIEGAGTTSPDNFVLVEEPKIMGKTLKELNVKPGDVVEFVSGGYVTNYEKPNTYLIGIVGEERHVSISGYGMFTYGYDAKFRLVSRATPLWKDMTPEEKGALLLAHHEGKIIEFDLIGLDDWQPISVASYADNIRYRIKPEPKVEIADATLKIHGGSWPQSIPVQITITDGQPDVTSIKMEKT